MGRRARVVIAVIFALFAGRVFVSHGIRPVSAAHTAYRAVATPSGESAPVNDGAAASIGQPEQPPKESPTELSPEPLRAESASAPQTATIQVDGVNDIDPHKAFGSKTAPIVMEVFSDYQCPSCKAFYMGTNRQLMDDYVSAGKVYIVHRDFPLPMHAYSRVAAQYARAAAELGKIEPVEKALYENQEKWEQKGEVDGTVAAVLSPAEMNKVRALVTNGTLEPLIQKDVQLGQMYRVNSTPTSVFHYKGQTYPYSGIMNWDTLRQFLDQLLSQK